MPRGFKDGDLGDYGGTTAKRLPFDLSLKRYAARRRAGESGQARAGR